MWIPTETALPMPGMKVLGWWPNWGGMMHVVHFNKKSWVQGNDSYGRKVSAPTHFQHTPEPPEDGPKN